MSDLSLKELDHQIAEAGARAKRLSLLIERQRQLGTPTRETEALIAELEEFLASMRRRRRMISGEPSNPACD